MESAIVAPAIALAMRATWVKHAAPALQIKRKSGHCVTPRNPVLVIAREEGAAITFTGFATATNSGKVWIALFQFVLSSMSFVRAVAATSVWTVLKAMP